MSELRSTRDHNTFRIIFSLTDGFHRRLRDYATVGRPVNRVFDTYYGKQYADSSSKESCTGRKGQLQSIWKVQTVTRRGHKQFN